MVLALVFVWIVTGCFRGMLTLNCEAGEYEQDDFCTPCPSPCTKCINNLICTECKPGFYGTTCEKQCSESCNERKCLQENGQCLSCVRGHYFGGNKSCVVCPGNCIECLSEDKCTSCKVGFKGDTCKEKCINCRQGTGCNLETGVCISGCQDGYSGHSCLEFCNSKCQSCERIDTNKCTVCVEGRYGINCEKTCPANCKNKKCNYDNRICTDGCQEEYWGDRCENTCPKQCLRGICLRENGLCSYGCRDNFTGSKCLCPDKCECSAKGVCEKCSNQSDYLCDNLCQTACVENICVRGVQTKCLYGYREGYDGSHCSLESRSSQLIPVLIVLAIAVVCAPIVTIFIIRYRKRISRLKCYQDALSEDEQPMVPRENQFKSTRISRKEIELLAKKSKHEIRLEFKDIIDSLSGVAPKVARGGVVDAMKIDGFATEEAYIACNAPTENDKVDFWEMVWSEKSDKIVCLSRDGAQSEDSQYKYWEKGAWRECGHVRVRPYVDDHHGLKKYSSADIELKQGQTCRCVTQFCYTIEIGDECIGDTKLATLLNDVKEIESETGGPLLVCSSNDTSLCGIYIALDMMLDEFESTKQVHVQTLVKQLLQQKPNLIKDELEYQFLHRTFLCVVDKLLEKRSPFWCNRKQRE